ncbi:MAG: hypothetical protein RM022_017430 [Nostoc sp. EfeVER01]|uniref:hypothetical protein n=1 Tax=unclassified Nostoc TaxID=2593658 RepID=UPI002AD3831A|nr:MULTISPECIES: hypothetical protein [unclassified Nostoc]MDZ7947562.1 hypothetical protein [Nostoc sp. EfeVER01]MDZ7994208.1 hypothetical protein [Nostoc sp. EspVER01]
MMIAATAQIHQLLLVADNIGCGILLLNPFRDFQEINYSILWGGQHDIGVNLSWK